MKNSFVLLDSITDVGPDHRGLTGISGSHGGLYPAAIASRAGLRAVVFNDAGIGLDNAGIGGVIALEAVGMAGAAVLTATARIGSASETLEGGIISFANAGATALGVVTGMLVVEAVELLKSAPNPTSILPEPSEARSVQRLSTGLEVHLLDSASMVGPEHLGKVVITGSHGALIGGDPERALKTAARIAVFNDAGFGPDRCGAARLPALDMKGIAAVCVSCDTARIGDAVSALETGTISAINTCSQTLGASIGQPLIDWLSAQG